MQWKIREGISEEVMLKFKLNERKGPFMQRFLRRGRGKYEYIDIKTDKLVTSGAEKELIGSEVKKQGRCWVETYFVKMVRIQSLRDTPLYLLCFAVADMHL